jgi:peptidoglycan hydrolase CwlO-like protein
MSKWYSLALFVPIWNLYLIYRLISTRDKESNDKIGIVKEVEIKNIQTKEKDITLNEIKNLNNKIIELEKINKILKLENNTKSLELENLNYRIKELEKNIEYLEVKYNNKIKYLNKKNNSYKDNKVFNNNYLKKVIESKSIYKTHYIII